MNSDAKEIVYDEAARHYLLTGIKKLTNAIVFTLGPKGKNVGMERSFGAPSFSNTGGAVAKEIELENPFENMGAKMAKEAIQKMKETCGDGTTTTTTLLSYLCEESVKFIESGAAPTLLKRGMETALGAIEEELKKQAIHISTDEEIEGIASAAVSGNTLVSSFINEAFKKVGKDGVILIEEGQTLETEIEIEEGMRIDRGYISSYFCTEPETMSVTLDEPLVLLVEGKINNIHELLPILQFVATKGASLLVIADEIEGDALSTLVINKIRGSLKVCAVKAPGFGDRRKELLKDLSALTSASVISFDLGRSLKDATPDDLGSVRRATITKETTTLLADPTANLAVQDRIKQIESEIKHSTTEYDKEKLAERKAKLSGGVAVIKVGAGSEPELKMVKQAMEDSLSATYAALEEGVVAGGGLALFHAADVVKTLNLKDDMLLGAQILQRACKMPLKQICMNGGIDGSLIAAEIEAQKNKKIGYNIVTETFEDFHKAWIMDPLKIVRNCLTQAVSLASLVMITEVLISDAKEEQ